MVDLGYGGSPITAVELHERLSSKAFDAPVDAAQDEAEYEVKTDDDVDVSCAFADAISHGDKGAE